VGSLRDEVRHRLGVPALRATTLPASWYGDGDHHRAEVDAVFRHGWSCIGTVDDVTSPGSFMTASIGGEIPVVVTRDAKGVLRGFLNVCRHRGSPVAEGCGSARLLHCPYHAWIYQLDGRLSKARGMRDVPGFDVADSGLFPVQVATWARFLFANPDLEAPQLDLGPLARAIDPFEVEAMELGVVEHTMRAFNWKLLVENYAENFHTPFVHPQLGGVAWGYPIENAGPISLAWDQPVTPRNRTEEVLARVRPTQPGWEDVASSQIDDPFLAGLYFTVFPNLLVSVFPRYFHALILTCVGPRATRVDYRRYWTPSVDEARRKADHEAALTVGEQDLDICERIQRSYDGGLDPRGHLSPEHEKGVAHLHQLLLRALDEFSW
jgi:phenylpropionate dioxygenase-like ring-hydroxylating dioxygenase large terminal subunit